MKGSLPFSLRLRIKAFLLGIVFLVLTLQLWVTVRPGSLSLPTGPVATRHKFAYALYVTDDNYACSAMVLIHRLLLLDIHPEVDIVVMYLTGQLRDVTLDAFTNITTTTFNQTHPHHHPWFHAKPTLNRVILKPISRSVITTSNSYYRECFFKLSVFTLFEYDRVIFMDSDGLPMHNLDHLFYLPNAFIASPRIYWGNPHGFSTAFMVVEPRNQSYVEMTNKLKFLLGGQEDSVSEDTVGFDMDFLNHQYENTTLLLPARYICLNSHWEVSEVGTYFIAHVDSLDALASYCEYIHFTALGKPWSYLPSSSMQQRPTAHPFFHKLFYMWWESASLVCSRELGIFMLSQFDEEKSSIKSQLEATPTVTPTLSSTYCSTESMTLLSSMPTSSLHQAQQQQDAPKGNRRVSYSHRFKQDTNE